MTVTEKDSARRKAFAPHAPAKRAAEIDAMLAAHREEAVAPLVEVGSRVAERLSTLTQFQFSGIAPNDREAIYALLDEWNAAMSRAKEGR